MSEAEPWEPELIPDPDRLFMRVQKTFVRNGEVIPGVFRDQGDGMSTDWEKYSTAEQARGRARVPADNAIVALVVGDVRSVPLSVDHTPDEALKNRAHTDVRGEKSPEVRLKLLRLRQPGWVVPPS